MSPLVRHCDAIDTLGRQLVTSIEAMLTRVRAWIFLLALVCCSQTNVHDTAQAKSEACVTCHQAAYDHTSDPAHADAGYPTTCGDCHASTTSWTPAKGGHVPNTAAATFPIDTGSHSNAAIACSDCHIASLGPKTAGANCDCIHCHIGAHTTPSIDTTHATTPLYDASTTPGLPANYCLGCHPAG
jgi:hypothetical protein